MGRRRQDGKRERILQAAARVFAQRGFYNAKVSEIARAAQVADGTIYLYFKNKDDLLISLFEEEMDKILSTVKKRLQTVGDPIQRLRTFVETHLELVEGNPAMAEVMQVELRQSNKFMKDYDNRKFKEYLNILGEIIAEGQKAGTIRSDVHPSVAKRVIFGALDEISTYWIFTRRKSLEVGEVANQICEMFTRGLVIEPALEGAEKAAL